FSHGFSLPSFEQTMYPREEDSRINEDIRHERGFNYEAGIKGNLASDKLYFEICAYYMDVRDLLVTQTLNAGTFSVNAGQAHFRGMELFFDHRLIRSAA